MALTDEDIRHVARLARLGLRDDEVARLRGEVSTILDHVSAISALPLADVPPTSHPLDLSATLAPDEAWGSLSHEEALRNAPDPTPEGFRVPPIGA